MRSPRLLVLLSMAAVSCSSGVDLSGVDLQLAARARNLTEPTSMTELPGGSQVILVGERGGLVRAFKPKTGLSKTAYLDISDRVNDGANERGLLRVIAHPDFADNGWVFVAYTDEQGDVRVSRFTGDADEADPGSEVVLLDIPHRDYPNHNGGGLEFAGGHLYVSVGDGGSGGDPDGNGQRLDTLLGTILRIDVDRSCGTLAYCIPEDNPFVGTAGARGEIYHYGLRNPWRFSIDPALGDMWIADVGQSDREEIDRATDAGLNFGWDCREGTLDTSERFGGGSTCAGGSFVDPVHEYGHDAGRCSVVGGFVYRGSIRPLRGAYVFGDHCTGEIWALTGGGDSWKPTALLTAEGRITSFGTDLAGELFVLTAEGVIYGLAA